MIKTRKPAHKLTIRTETLRQLDDTTLGRVAGQARAEPSDGYVCETISHNASCWGSCSTRLWC